MRLTCKNTLFCVRECGGGHATLAAKFILAEAETRMRAKNAIPLIACTVGSHASAPRHDQEQKHGGLAIVKTGIVPRTLMVKHGNQNVVGEVYHNEPIKRIFINLKRSGTYQHYKRYNVKCHFLCTRHKLNDGVTTILHEASHAAINTKDFFISTV